MNDIKLNLNEAKKGAFTITESDEQIAEMVVGIIGKDLIVYHTEVDEKFQGKGVSSMLFDGMVDYARKENLKVVPLCSYVALKFKRHPDDYGDLWNKEWHP